MDADAQFAKSARDAVAAAGEVRGFGPQSDRVSIPVYMEGLREIQAQCDEALAAAMEDLNDAHPV